MWFRKKKKEEVFNLIDMLRERPDEMFVCSEYMACWVPIENKALIIHGNFTHLNEIELNIFLQEVAKYKLAHLN